MFQRCVESSPPLLPPPRHQRHSPCLKYRERLLAQFVPYVSGCFEQGGSVTVWRLPSHLSQSRLGDRQESSNACTIIIAKMAELMHRQAVEFPTAHRWQIANNNHPFCIVHNNGVRAAAGGRLPLVAIHNQPPYPTAFYQLPPVELCRPSLLSALINAIVEGNEIHRSAVVQRANGEQNFTIPDALAACEATLSELDFTSVKGGISRHLPDFIRRAITCKMMATFPHVFLMLIAYERTVLLVYQRSNATIGICDSHWHGFEEGATLACAAVDQLDSFCSWISHNIFPESNSKAPAEEEFEISAVHFAGDLEPHDCAPPLNDSESSVIFNPLQVFTDRAIKRPHSSEMAAGRCSSPAKISCLEPAAEIETL